MKNIVKILISTLFLCILPQVIAMNWLARTTLAGLGTLIASDVSKKAVFKQIDRLEDVTLNQSKRFAAFLKDQEEQGYLQTFTPQEEKHLKTITHNPSIIFRKNIRTGESYADGLYNFISLHDQDPAFTHTTAKEKSEIKSAIACHEAGHIKNNDYIKGLLFSGATALTNYSLLYYIAKKVIPSVTTVNKNNLIKGTAKYATAIGLLKGATIIAHNMYQRSREFEADEHVPLFLLPSFAKYFKIHDRLEKEELKKNYKNLVSKPIFSLSYFSDICNFARQGAHYYLPFIFSNHPADRERYNNLKEYKNRLFR